MIPYDDLVIALATWRARQGLPVSGLSGALSPPMAVSAAVSAPPPRPAAPVAPPRPTAPVAVVAPPAPVAPVAAKAPSGPTAVPPPLAPPPEDSLDHDMLEPDSVYENEGDDFAMAFPAGAAAVADPEATAIGGAPRPAGFGDLTDPGHDVAGAQRPAQAPEESTGEHTIAGGDADRTDW